MKINITAVAAASALVWSGSVLIVGLPSELGVEMQVGVGLFPYMDVRAV